MRRCGCLQDDWSRWKGKFREGGNQFPTMRASDDRFIAREFTVQTHPTPGDPHQWIEPQDTQRTFVEQTNQVVPASRVREFVDEDGVEFTRIQNAFDVNGKQDARIENAANRGTRLLVAEAHGNAVSQKV